jgi:polysaccharide pyruvyl transferase WcaK-like protein
MRVLFINDSTSDPNWGDRAAAISLRALMVGAGADIVRAVSEHDIATSSFGQSRPEWTESGPSRTRALLTLLAPPWVLRIRRRLVRYPDSQPARRFVPRRWEDFESCADAVMRDKGTWPDFLRTVEGTDVTVIHGDGGISGNGVFPHTVLFLAYLIKTRCGKPVTLVNHTADLDHPVLREMATNVYPLLDDVVFRDPISADRCRSICDGRYAPDTAFSFAAAARDQWVPIAKRATYFDVWPDGAHFDPERPYVCIGGSSVFHYEPSTVERTKKALRLVEGLMTAYHGQIVLVASDPIDSDAFRPISRQLDLPLVALTTPVQQAVDIVGNAEAYIGGRWHPSIFALRGGAPVIALTAKTFKMEALLQMAGLSSSTLDGLQMDRLYEPIFAQLRTYLEQGEGLRSRLRSWASEQAALCGEHVAYLRKDECVSPGPGSGGGPS